MPFGATEGLVCAELCPRIAWRWRVCSAHGVEMHFGYDGGTAEAEFDIHWLPWPLLPNQALQCL